MDNDCNNYNMFVLCFRSKYNWHQCTNYHRNHRIPCSSPFHIYVPDIVCFVQKVNLKSYHCRIKWELRNHFSDIFTSRLINEICHQAAPAFKTFMIRLAYAYIDVKQVGNNARLKPVYYFILYIQVILILVGGQNTKRHN